MKSNHFRFTGILLLALSLGACNRAEDELGKVLSKEFRNPALKEITAAGIAPVLQKTLNERELPDGKLISAYYRNKDFAPVLLRRHLPDGGADALLERIEKAGEHGLDPALFHPEELRGLLDSLRNKEVVSTAEAAAPLVARLELQLAASLASYGNALQFGLVNPEEILPRYYIETSRPDSASLTRLFEAQDLGSLLDSIQPSGAGYKALQQALAAGGGAGPGAEIQDADKRRALIVNLERLRWKNQPSSGKYVIVNIPDYRLDVMENGASVLNMKVCVGEPEKRWQTPQLNSLIERVQVNPIWHIPKSIAAGEIIKKAAADRYYLDNAGIDVYENGELVSDSRKIKWDKVSGKEMSYTFKQRPGSQNALGKIKFLFENQSSVYLHDTPAKTAFDQETRAVSHGCVRVEKPVELARALFGEGNKFELIKTEMGKENPEAKNVELTDKVPVYLVYATCRADQQGNLEFRPDVYGLDSLVFNHLQAQRTAQQPGR